MSKSNSNKSDGEKFDGVQSAAEMLNLLDKESRERLLSQLEERDPRIAQEVRKKMFIFEDLVKIESPGLQVLLREFPEERLILALRNMDEEFRSFILSQYSLRTSVRLREDLAHQGPQKLSEVTRAQQDLVRLAQKMVQEGKIILGRGKANR